jgi:subtilase family serine protease
MKIYYREPTVLEQMANAIRDSKNPIDYFELTSEEINANYSNFDRTIKDKIIYYSYKGIPVKVKE